MIAQICSCTRLRDLPFEPRKRGNIGPTGECGCADGNRNILPHAFLARYDKSGGEWTKATTLRHPPNCADASASLSVALMLPHPSPRADARASTSRREVLATVALALRSSSWLLSQSGSLFFFEPSQ